MTFFTNAYESKLDAKGRLVLPSRIKAQLPEGSNEIMIRHGYEPCLILYPMVEFKKVFAKVSALPEWKAENRLLQRSLLSRSTSVEMDANGRFLIPKVMLDYATLEKDVKLVGVGNRVEIWNPEIYEKHLLTDSEAISNLSEKFLGDVNG